MHDWTWLRLLLSLVTLYVLRRRVSTWVRTRRSRQQTRRLAPLAAEAWKLDTGESILSHTTLPQTCTEMVRLERRLAELELAGDTPERARLRIRWHALRTLQNEISGYFRRPPALAQEMDDYDARVLANRISYQVHELQGGELPAPPYCNCRYCVARRSALR